MAADHDPKMGARAIGWRIGGTAAALVTLVGLGILLAFSEIGASLESEALMARIRGFGAWGNAAENGPSPRMT